MFKLVYTRRAVRDIRRLDPATKRRIGQKLLKYVEDPLKHAEKITDPELGSFRFRIGDYRVIFDLKADDVIVLRVGHRRDIYRR
ncbi:MAG: type II toxin-antitoxin system RelE/ParE family toxin [Desulfobacterales bacterium]|nr:type II toxin-antitoxin system RelE/ParE family toxin [Desulfobacterales bacterium]